MADPDDLMDEIPPEEPDGLPEAEVIDLTRTADPLLSQWARFRDLFKAAMSDGFWTIEDLEQKIAHRRAFFFPGAESALVAQIEVYPGGVRVFQVLWGVGNLDELVQMAPGVESIARMMGCHIMLIEGDAGWQRVLEGHGYKLWSVTLHKRL